MVSRAERRLGAGRRFVRVVAVCLHSSLLPPPSSQSRLTGRGRGPSPSQFANLGQPGRPGGGLQTGTRATTSRQHGLRVGTSLGHGDFG